MNLAANTFKLLAACAALFSLPHVAVAQNTEQSEVAAEQSIFEENGIKLVHGPARVKLDRYAEINLPENFAFIGGDDSLRKYYRMTENNYSGNEIGAVLAYDGWVIFFNYTDSGHIDDKEKADLDASTLYKQMEENQKLGNAENRKKGWAELRLKGWTSKPHYDEKTNNLTWAFRLASSKDDYTETFINQNIRLLGRTGYVSAVLVGGDDVDYAKTEVAANDLLKNFQFTPGQTYAEFKSGDKVAKYGLAALVLGGAGAVAAKTGFLSKFLKYIIFGVAAAGAWFVRMFKKITGRGTGKNRFGDDSNS